MTYIIDGDTVVIDEVHYRLAGIDAPEGSQAGGDEATLALERLLAEGHYTIRVTGTDYWDREIAWFDLPQGGSINCTLVRQGYAWAYRKYSKKCIPDEQVARREKLGVFATDSIPPWQYRHNH